MFLFKLALFRPYPIVYLTFLSVYCTDSTVRGLGKVEATGKALVAVLGLGKVEATGNALFFVNSGDRDCRPRILLF